MLLDKFPHPNVYGITHKLYLLLLKLLFVLDFANQLRTTLHSGCPTCFLRYGDNPAKLEILLNTDRLISLH